MRETDFIAFILTHGRPDKVFTYDALRESGYTGRIMLVIDNEDSKGAEYRERYGSENVYEFDKVAISETFDEADNFGDRRAIVYARNACFAIAQELGIKYFIELDDDYTQFRYTEDENGEYITDAYIKNLDAHFDLLLDYFKNNPRIHSIALAQGGDFIGGATSRVFRQRLSRKCMNSFICSTERPFKFVGRVNEDVNTYTTLATRGLLLFTTSLMRLEQMQTQANSGGMTEMYIDSGTYLKSFYTVMMSPSCVRVAKMGPTHGRLHHRISWPNCVPCIIREEHRKQR